MKTIGFIGLGNMGTPMCMNLIKAGYPAVVNDVNKERIQHILDAGAQFAESACEVAKQSDVIFTMLPNGKILKAVIGGETGIAAGLTPGKIQVDMSTVSPEESAEAAEIIESKGCGFLRCPVTGSTGLAATGSLGLLLSGEEAVFKEVEPMLDCLGNVKYWIGNKDEARTMKIAINTMVGNTAQMLAEAVTLAEKSGIDPAKCMEIMAGSAVGSAIVKSKVGLISEGKYDPMFSVKMMMKDFDLAIDTAKQLGVSLPMTTLVRQYYEEAKASGHGNEDYAVLVKRQEKNIGIDR